MERRIKIVFSVFCIWFSLVGFRLWYMQVLSKNRFQEMSQANRMRILRLPSARGKIYDRNGRLIVDNKAAVQLVVSAEEVKDMQVLAQDVSSLTKLPTEYSLKKIKEGLFKPFIPAILAADMSDETLVRVSESRWRLPGVTVQVSPVRDYLLGEICSHLIGYVGEVGKRELGSGYSYGDIVGRIGIENEWDRQLRGQDGYKELQVDYRGNIDTILNIIEPEIGESLYLTIDSELQEELYNLMKGNRGAGIVMDPNNGEILAIVSTPGFNPNLLVSPVKEEVVTNLFVNKSRPMLNRAISGLYPPGSIFKIVVALSALEKGTITKKNLFYCDGVFQLGNTKFKCWEKKGHGWMDLSGALKKSCNEYFYQVGLKVGPSAIVDMASLFGLGRCTGIKLLGEKEGLLPCIYGQGQDKPKMNIKESKWFSGDTVNLSIGHGKILVTPIQVACLVSAIANGGMLYKPLLTLDENKEGIEINIDKEYIDIVKGGLFRVVSESDGTGHRAYVSGLDIAGKTGTVALKEGKRKRNICWFAGFAKTQINADSKTQINADYKTQINADSEPSVVVVIVVEEGEGGGTTAAPIAQKVFKTWARNEKRLTINE